MLRSSGIQLNISHKGHPRGPLSPWIRFCYSRIIKLIHKVETALGKSGGQKCVLGSKGTLKKFTSAGDGGHTGP